MIQIVVVIIRGESPWGRRLSLRIYAYLAERRISRVDPSARFTRPLLLRVSEESHRFPIVVRSLLLFLLLWLIFGAGILLVSRRRRLSLVLLDVFGVGGFGSRSFVSFSLLLLLLLKWVVLLILIQILGIGWRSWISRSSVIGGHFAAHPFTGIAADHRRRSVMLFELLLPQSFLLLLRSELRLLLFSCGLSKGCLRERIPGVDILKNPAKR